MARPRPNPSPMASGEARRCTKSTLSASTAKTSTAPIPALLAGSPTTSQPSLTASVAPYTEPGPAVWGCNVVWTCQDDPSYRHTQTCCTPGAPAKTHPSSAATEDPSSAPNPGVPGSTPLRLGPSAVCCQCSTPPELLGSRPGSPTNRSELEAARATPKPE